MKTIILLSGGLDSAVLLADRLNAGDEIHTISFDYGQTHAERELAAAATIAYHYGVPNRIIKLGDIFGACALRGHGNIPAQHAETPDATTVPARNLVFLSVGVAVAESVGASCVMFGAIRDDERGYLDCRYEFIEAMSEAAYFGTGKRITVAAPFTQFSKQTVAATGRALGVPFDLTWSCYRGGDVPCGRCGACQSRDEAML